MFIRSRGIQRECITNVWILLTTIKQFLDFLAMIVMNKVGLRSLLVQLCALGTIIGKLDFLVTAMNKIRLKGSCHDNEWTLVTIEKTTCTS
jgi:hypothetical protein